MHAGHGAARGVMLQGADAGLELVEQVPLKHAALYERAKHSPRASKHIAMPRQGSCWGRRAGLGTEAPQ